MQPNDIEEFLSVLQQFYLENQLKIEEGETEVANYLQDQVGGVFVPADLVHVKPVTGSFSRIFHLFFDRFGVSSDNLQQIQPYAFKFA